MSLRIVFMGTPDFSVPVLAEIIGAGHEVAAVYSRAPKPAGRGMAMRRSPVHELADRFAIPVQTPKSLRTDEAARIFRSHNADVAVVVAYGLILPKAILDAPAHGCLNLHASLLPRWRGAAPIQRAIMAGDAETGVMVMRMDEGLDTGPVAMAERVAIGADATAGDLRDALSKIGADLMGRALAALSRGALATRPQPVEGVTYGADMRLLVNAGGIPTVLFGPGDVRVAHMPDEYVPIEELRAAAQALVLVVLRFCGVEE